MKDFNQAINLNPNHLKAFYNRALAKGRLDDYESAIDDLTKAIEIDSQYLNAYFSRAYWREFKGDNQAAINDYKKVIEIDPQFKEAYIGLATVMYKNNQKTEACDVLKQAEQKGDIQAEALFEKLCK
jgi:Tfp pilus assembly protein PilF